MAKNRVAAPKAKGKVRGTLTDHEVALIAELVEARLSYRQAIEKLAAERGVKVK
jgi:hypothetical protein